MINTSFTTAVYHDSLQNVFSVTITCHSNYIQRISHRSTNFRSSPSTITFNESLELVPSNQHLQSTLSTTSPYHLTLPLHLHGRPNRRRHRHWRFQTSAQHLTNQKHQHLLTKPRHTPTRPWPPTRPTRKPSRRRRGHTARKARETRKAAGGEGRRST
jgi:hypothetical protein